MKENNTIEIANSKAKLAKLLVISILFLTAGLWMLITDPHSGNAFFNLPVVKFIGAYGSTLMGLWGIFFFTIKLFDKKPGVVLSGDGIIINTGAFDFGLVPWRDVTQVYERSASGQRFVVIGVDNPEDYIAAEKNVFKRKMLEANAKYSGSPLQVSANGLDTNHDRLLGLVTVYFEEYGHGVM